MVVASGSEESAHLPGDLGATGNSEGPALAEVVLHVHDDDRGCHGFDGTRAVDERQWRRRKRHAMATKTAKATAAISTLAHRGQRSSE